MPHTAVLLAGGKSSRMGRDKAALPLDGEPLWQRQLATLRATQPAELLISGPSDGPYADAGVKIVRDTAPARGPLGGVSAALSACASPWLLVLAVDVPFMSAAYLEKLLAEVERTGRGVVPIDANGHIEPLVAIYPRAAGVFAAQSLLTPNLQMTAWVRLLESNDLMGRLDILPHEQGWFKNWNRPEDLRGDQS